MTRFLSMTVLSLCLLLTLVGCCPGDCTSASWRDYALAAVQGFERGATAPVTVTRCNTYSRRGNVGTYCTSSTY